MRVIVGLFLLLTLSHKTNSFGFDENDHINEGLGNNTLFRDLNSFDVSKHTRFNTCPSTSICSSKGGTCKSIKECHEERGSRHDCCTGAGGEKNGENCECCVRDGCPATTSGSCLRNGGTCKKFCLKSFEVSCGSDGCAGSCVCCKAACTTPCYNGGECRINSCSDSSGQCMCPLDYTGKSCTEARCDPPCENGGTCITPNKCLCKGEFSGEKCEFQKFGTNKKYCERKKEGECKFSACDTRNKIIELPGKENPNGNRQNKCVNCCKIEYQKCGTNKEYCEIKKEGECKFRACDRKNKIIKLPGNEKKNCKRQKKCRNCCKIDVPAPAEPRSFGRPPVGPFGPAPLPAIIPPLLGPLTAPSTDGEAEGKGGPLGGAVEGEGGPLGGAVEREGGPLGGAVEGEGGPPDGAVEREGGPLGGAVEREGTPLGGAVEGEGGLLGGAVEVEGGPMGGAVEREGGPLGGAVEGEGGPLGAAVEREGGPLGGAVEREGGLLGGAVEREGGPLGAAVEREGGPLGGAVEREGGPLGAAVEREGGPLGGAVEREGDPLGGAVERE